ncbi:hypothetical protein GC098_07460 [Paenibacillus sp. LMG 31458]|uniref:Uncharacterized protein n=1 Tax=Paenibacillus phytorum TaxID=2654977 RepID=A0ABX1XRU6_9BACL|nr:hypothetical protein [Paenibacillus phytorum]NOU71260.1 hypothetical protein [Paenibacillus phytorum]
MKRQPALVDWLPFLNGQITSYVTILKEQFKVGIGFHIDLGIKWKNKLNYFGMDGVYVLKLIWRIGASLILLWIVFLLVHLGIVLLQKIKVEKNTAAFLKAVQSKDFGKAAELYGSPIDLEKMRKLHEEEGFRLLNYDNIRADYDDGCVCSVHARRPNF